MSLRGGILQEALALLVVSRVGRSPQDCQEADFDSPAVRDNVIMSSCMSYNVMRDA